jgi:ATP-dependent RNA helicase SUPV3L1/SUV3
MLERLSDLIRARVTWRPAEGTEGAPPAGATGDGGFRVVPELMSMVGCSGDEFASILRALGFRLDRRKLEGGNGLTEPAEAMPATSEPAPAETAPEETVAAVSPEATAQPEGAAAEPAFDEIWRPGKRRETHRPPRGGRDSAPRAPGEASAKRPPRHGKGHDKGQGKPRGQERGQTRGPDRQHQPKRERPTPEHSPFAALKELRDTLAARARSDRS